MKEKWWNRNEKRLKTRNSRLKMERKGVVEEKWRKIEGKEWRKKLSEGE
jgi:hypothetical protein